MIDRETIDDLKERSGVLIERVKQGLDISEQLIEVYNLGILKGIEYQKEKTIENE